jgi:hypothetical protein
MSVETITRAIQFILAPVVMVSSCALLLTGILTIYNNLGDRLRAFTRERLDLLRGKDGGLDLDASRDDTYKMERLREIDELLPGMLRRHELVHQSALAMCPAIMILTLGMFAIAVAVITELAAVATLAFVIFLLGTAALVQCGSESCILGRGRTALYGLSFHASSFNGEWQSGTPGYNRELATCSHQAALNLTRLSQGEHSPSGYVHGERLSSYLGVAPQSQALEPGG